jgi:hypothetical protein
MDPEFDPNEAIENSIKETGEFLRDADKGMSATELAHNIDLGTVREDSQRMEQLSAVSEEGQLDPDEIARMQVEDSKRFVSLGNTIRQERVPDEKHTQLTVDAAAMERLTFPGEQHTTQVRSSMENNLREDREWKATVAELFWAQAEMIRQQRLELDLIRGYLERINL